MSKNQRLTQSFETAMKWKGETGKQGDSRGYSVSKEEAFQRILPKNIKPETVRKWRLVCGLESKAVNWKGQ